MACEHRLFLLERVPNMKSPNKTSENFGRKVVRRLVLPFTELPYEGVDLEATEDFDSLHIDPETRLADQNLNEFFKAPIRISGSLTPVGTKVDVRGEFDTVVTEVCDRCTGTFETPLKGSISTFLMPKQQFSAHDKPGGKVIHGPTRDQKKSRHHSSSKAEILTDAEGEHEDLSFGAFDGETIDLRDFVREQLILGLPMTNICSEACRGLCMKCGENISKGDCRCAEGPSPVAYEDTEKPLSQLGRALAERAK